MDENENTPNPDAEQAPNPNASAGDAAESAANPYDPAGKGGVPDSDDDDQDDDDVPDHARAVTAGLRVDKPGALEPGSDPHAVKVGTDNDGRDVFAHHDASGVRFAL